MHRGNGNYNAILEACSSKVVCNLSAVGEKLANVKMVDGLAARIMVQFQKNGKVIPPQGRLKVDFVHLVGHTSKRAAAMAGNWYVINLTASEVETIGEGAGASTDPEKDYAILVSGGTGNSAVTHYAGRGEIDFSVLDLE